MKLCTFPSLQSSIPENQQIFHSGKQILYGWKTRFSWHVKLSRREGTFSFPDRRRCTDMLEPGGVHILYAGWSGSIPVQLSVG
jgi:hypothetical protein